MIVLHHCPGSRSMRVLWLLNELDVPFEMVLHAFDTGLRAPQHLVLSPAGRVPALEMDGDSCFESGAILEILCERYSRRGLGRLTGDLDRPDWLVWVHFAETVTQHVSSLIQQHVICPPQERSEFVMRVETEHLHGCFAAIEGRLSTPVENSDYLLTSGFSAADIAVGQAVWMAQHFTTLDDFPETAAWFQRITERESFRRALPDPGRGIFAQGYYPQPHLSGSV
ncbi:glutathione S-transferase family protein [Pseudooceanicola algae]|uniref:Uncharacterized protein n=1 Tax=Pseudooceanicola algae TaxID=1537215 RepID=A0A418SFB4_9RHOB|nr:glutathione S-transferase family protein [Pseudooceanicola algae]QPM89267.1 hypothetical protein PSAL_004820 [Pseudooceanicola algae]